MLIRRIIPVVLCVGLGAAEVVEPAPPTTGVPGTGPTLPQQPDPAAKDRTGPVSPVAPDPKLVPPAVPPTASAKVQEEFPEGRVTSPERIRPVNTVDPVNGRGVDGMKWIYAVRTGGIPREPIYIAFSSERSLVEFEQADSETRRKYIDIARGILPEVDPRTQGEPGQAEPVK